MEKPGDRRQGEDDGLALICDGDAVLHTRHMCVENPTEIHIASRNGTLQDIAVGEVSKDGHYEGICVYALDFLVAMEKAGFGIVRIEEEPQRIPPSSKQTSTLREHQLATKLSWKQGVSDHAQSQTEDESREAEKSTE